MLFTKAIEHEYLKHGKKFFLIFQIIIDHFFKGFYDLSQALDQCKTNIGNDYCNAPKYTLVVFDMFRVFCRHKYEFLGNKTRNPEIV